MITGKNSNASYPELTVRGLLMELCQTTHEVSDRLTKMDLKITKATTAMVHNSSQLNFQFYQ